MRLQAGVDMRARCRKLGGGVVTKWTLAILGDGGVLRNRSERGSGCGECYLIPLEVRKVPLLGAGVIGRRAGVRGRDRTTQRGDRETQEDGVRQRVRGRLEVGRSHSRCILRGC